MASQKGTDSILVEGVFQGGNRDDSNNSKAKVFSSDCEKCCVGEPQKVRI